MAQLRPFMKTAGIIITAGIFLSAAFAVFAQESGFTPGMVPGGVPEGSQVPGGAVPEEMQQQIMAQMKKQMGQLKRPLVRIEQMMEKVRKQGSEVPQEILNAYNEANAAIQTIENAETFGEEVQGAIESFNEAMEVFSESGEKLMMLIQWPKVMKKITNEITRLEKMFEKSKKKLEGSDMNTASAVAETQKKIDALKGLIAQAESIAKSGDGENAFVFLEDALAPAIEEAYHSVGLLNALKNIQKATRTIAKGLVSAEKVITKLEKKGIDTSELKLMLEEARTAFSELNNLLGEPDPDLDALVELMESLGDLRDQFEETVAGLTEDEDVGNLPSVNFFGGKFPKVPKIPSGGLGGPQDFDQAKINF